MTPNPINAFKITIHNTKHTQNTKIHFENSDLFKIIETIEHKSNNINNTFRFLLYMKIP